MEAKQTLGEPRLLVSRSALIHNARVVRNAVGPETRLCAIIKANAYGHGASLVADTLSHFGRTQFDGPGVDALAVATADEAAELPATDLPIYIFRPVENTYLGRQRAKLETAIRRGWTLTVCSPAAVSDIARVAIHCNRRANVQVMIETGMNRSGVPLSHAVFVIEAILAQPALKLTAVATHFACSEVADDALNTEQLERFLGRLDGLPRGVIRHAANSGAIFFHRNAHLDMVRPGISLYGIDPTCKPVYDRPLKPAMKWTAPLLMVRDVPMGGGVGYGQRWTAKRNSRIGLLPVGYADGYLRAFTNKAVVMLHGRPAPVAGTVSMDMTTIDLTDHPHAAPGDEVTILDDDPLSPCSVYALAKHADTIPYEIFCRIGTRSPRIAIDPSDDDALAYLNSDLDEAMEDGQ